MSITEAQATRIAAYHEARKPYAKLLFETMDDAPANTTNTKQAQASDMKPEGAEQAQPLPGAHFAELVDVLMESKIVNVDEKGARRKL